LRVWKETKKSTLYLALFQQFYENMSSVYGANPYEPHRIWDSNETSLQVGSCGMLVLKKRGNRNVSHIIPNSKESVTILCCVNVSGQRLPIFYLFKGKK
jgi:hypothetical protein